MKTRCSLLIALLALYSTAMAQNLTGTWRGIGGGETYRLVIVQFGDSCFGYTYDTGMGYCKANFTGKYDSATKKLNGKNTSFIERTTFHSLSVYHLNYYAQNNEEYLRGRAAAKTIGAKLMSFGMPIPITYKKVSDEIDTTKLVAEKIVFYKSNTVQADDAAKRVVAKQNPISDSLKIQPAGPLADLKAAKESRVSKLVQTIETSADSIKLVLYDNGEIDGDTVTVFDNGTIIINRLALGVKAYEFTIPINKNNPLHSIELMANNLGSIPPNTAYMQILAGKERYELRLSSDFSVNAQVNITYKE